jgi:hypothetical protein
MRYVGTVRVQYVCMFVLSKLGCRFGCHYKTTLCVNSFKISSVSRGKIDIKRILKEKIESPKINVMIGSVVSDNYCTSHLTTNNEVALLFDTYVD